MKLYAWNVKQELIEYKKICHVGSIGPWFSDRFSDLELAF